MAKRRLPKNVVLLKTPKVRAAQSVVELLNDALKEAKAGKITQCVLVYEGGSDWAWWASAIPQLNSILGAMCRAEKELIEEMGDRGEGEWKGGGE